MVAWFSSSSSLFSYKKGRSDITEPRIEALRSFSCLLICFAQSSWKPWVLERISRSPAVRMALTASSRDCERVFSPSWSTRIIWCSLFGELK